jgi:hypothetical protein
VYERQECRGGVGGRERKTNRQRAGELSVVMRDRGVGVAVDRLADSRA